MVAVREAGSVSDAVNDSGAGRAVNGEPRRAHSAHDLAFVLPDLRLGGAQRVACQLLDEWSRRGIHVCLITLSATDSDFFTAHPFSRVALGMQQPSNSTAAALVNTVRRVRHLRRAIRQADAPRALSFIAGTNILTLLATRGLPLRVVVSERNDPARQRIGRVWELLRRRCYRWADVVTANSVGAMDALHAHVPAARLVLIPNSVTPRAPTDPALRRPVFLAVGRLSHQKSFDILLQAFAKTRARCPGWRLTIVGDGEESASLRDLATTLGVGDLVTWTGLVAEPDTYYREAGIFVLSSRHEGMPNALLEAMAAGMPVVVTDALSEATDLVSQPGSGRVTKTNDPVALAEAMCELAANSELRARMGAAAAAAIGDRSVSSVLARWNDVLGLDVPPQ